MRSPFVGFLPRHDKARRPQAGNRGKIRDKATHSIRAAEIGEDVLEVSEDADRWIAENTCDFCGKRLQWLWRQTGNVQSVAMRAMCNSQLADARVKDKRSFGLGLGQ
ncbi:hypothetical protein IQ26_05849 [Mesorhizobium tianshanense]|uniref:Uncharacterized protein n=1 Tax=Mesorhizobium tianshanense TaxID=39844 RepID=A0A562N4J3_9HYPH|nr:hypothetical protein IQ26_05849 [Mesorhizobium tianshanense]